MIKKLFEHYIGNNRSYDALAVFDFQVRRLVNSNLITTEVQRSMEEAFMRKKEPLEDVCKKSSNGDIPFMVCPNPKLFSLETLFKNVHVGGKSQDNTLFLNLEKITNIWDQPLNSAPIYFASHIETGIRTGIKFEPQIMDALKKAPPSALGSIQKQQPDVERLTFYETLMLSFYYPDIYDIWDGIEALGSYYGDAKHILRLYWLNDKPNRYLKVARENHPLWDERFISPRVNKRIICE